MMALSSPRNLDFVIKTEYQINDLWIIRTEGQKGR